MTTADDDIAHIVVNGSEYYRWKALRLQRDWHTNPSVFSFVVAEPGQLGSGWNELRLKPGDQADVYLGGVRAAHCYITNRTAAFDPESHDVIVSGKSITTDLDSSVPVKPGTFNGMTMEQVTRSLIKPHGVGLVTKNTGSIFSKPFTSLVPQYGETCFEMIQRMCNMRAVDLCDDADGNLVIGNGDPSAGSVAQLVEGQNIISGRGTLEDQTAWSSLSLVGQNVGSDSSYPPRDISATVSDSNTRSNRVRIIPAVQPGDVDEMQAAANKEATRNAWPQVNVIIVVRGWKRPDGQLWQPVDNIDVYSPMLFPNESGSLKLGIQSVLFQQDSQNGTTTTLTLVKPEALSSVGSANTGSIPGAGQDASGNQVDNPVPSAAKPDTPDTFSGTV